MEGSRISLIGINIPVLGGGFRKIYSDERAATHFIEADFQSWTFIGEYLAVMNAAQGFVEILLSPGQTRQFPVRILMRMAGKELSHEQRGLPRLPEDFSVPFESKSEAMPKFRLGLPSSAMGLVRTNRRADFYHDYIPSGLSLFFEKRLIEGMDARSAAARFKEVTDSVLFEMDLRFNLAFDILRFRDNQVAGPVRRVDYSAKPNVPALKYSPEAAALYRYARSSGTMPLLSYLAFYQVLEHFFPAYYERAIITRLQQATMDPLFDPHNKSHLSKLVQISAGRGAGSERDQLKATLRYCIPADEVEEFLRESSERAAFLADKSALAEVRAISPRDANYALTDQIAERVYQIRCRIVHSKDGGTAANGAPMLLPFSTEANKLGYDTQLIKFLAQKALIASADRAPWTT
ncbi:hypothetical protein [Actinoplanes sp. NPDC051851]|uniref:hypothetical protein n=1 Tax=Actinoplanes sp. NPDC051851 TaxID=3154753 RepID=UPI00344A82BC